MNIDYSLKIMELERRARESRMKHDAAVAKQKLIEDTLRAGVDLYVAILTAPLQALASELRNAETVSAEVKP